MNRSEEATEKRVLRRATVELSARERSSREYHARPSNPEFCPRDKPCSCENAWREHLTASEAAELRAALPGA